MTKADVLDSLDTLQVCNSYKVDNKEIDEVPFQMFRMNIEPVYKSFEGWKTDITQIKSFEEVPSKMKLYINYLNETLKIPVKYISNGPGSDQLIVAS
jgi:adenylosuccinate synthase